MTGRLPRGTFWELRVRRPLVALLRAGATPEKLALGMALGLTLGIFPVLGVTTLLCALAALALRLNPVAIQLVNYLVYPVHLGLLLPFVRLGERLVGVEPIPLSLRVRRASLAEDTWGTVRRLWRTELHAITAWGVVAPFLAVAAYAVFLPLLRALAARLRQPPPSPAA